MRGLNYLRLKRITEINKPYRGSTTRFPIGGRREIRRCFYVRMENGEIVYDITYGYNWKRHPLTKEEYEARKERGDKNIADYNNGDYYFFESVPRLMGTVRSDNTFEFRGDTYDQGDRMFLSTYTYGWFVNDSRRGGMLYKSSGSKGDMFPIWRGMRVNCETMRPIDDYKVITKQVNRKDSKSLTSGYKNFIKTAETMLNAMDWRSFIGMAEEIHVQYKLETGEQYDREAYEQYPYIAERIKDEAPLDAAVLYMLAMDVGNLRWDIRHSRNNAITRGDETPAELFANVLRGLNKAIYKANQDVFKRVEYGPNERYPSSDWGVEVIVNGVPHVQYGYGV
jgi:hypothetical protein